MSDISKVAAANPYRNQPYKESFWQRALSKLGFRTQADAWRENMNVQAAEYDAAVAQKKFDTEYESAVEQVNRMKVAGLNPDLNPSSVSAGDAAPMGDDPSTPMQSTGEEGALGNFVSGIMTCFSSALGMVSTFQGIHRNALENRLLGFQTSKDVAGYGFDIAPFFLSPWSEGNDMNVYEHLDNAYNLAQIFSSRNLPKRYRSTFNDAVRSFYESAPGESSAYKSWYDSIKSQKGFYSEKNTFYSPRPETMEKIYSILGSVEERIWQLNKTAEGAEASERTVEADYNAELIGALDPKAEAAAKNAEFGARKNQADVTNILRRSVNDILGALKSDNSEFAGLFGFILRLYSLYMFSK